MEPDNSGFFRAVRLSREQKPIKKDDRLKRRYDLLKHDVKKKRHWLLQMIGL